MMPILWPLLLAIICPAGAGALSVISETRSARRRNRRRSLCRGMGRHRDGNPVTFKLRCCAPAGYLAAGFANYKIAILKGHPALRARCDRGLLHDKPQRSDHQPAARERRFALSTDS